MGFLGGVRKIRSFLRVDKSFGIDRDFAMLRQGFFSKRRYFYPFDKFPKEFLITDWEIEFGFRALNPSTAKENLKNKVFFQLMLRHSPVFDRTPGVVGVVANGQYRSFSEFNTLDAIFKAKERVFLKPVSGWAGDGCILASSRKQVPETGSYTIEDCGEPHTYSSDIFPHSINTIRVFTLKDEFGEPFIVGAAHRFGGSIKNPIDNFSKGGISCGIDMETGILRSGLSNPGFHSTIFHEYHPVTGVKLSGVQVPFWEESKKLALDLARYFGDLNYAGWDIYVSPTGPMVIEGNGDLPHPDLIQVHSPLLASRRVRNQLQKFGMISLQRKDYIDRLCQTSHIHLDRP